MKIKPIAASVYEALREKGSPASLLWLEKYLYYPKNEIKTALRGLLRDGKIIRARGKCYGLPREAPPETPLMTGRLTVHPDGYAFFIPEDGGEDLFVAATKVNGAVDGDIVRVRKARYRGRIEAHVAEVVERKLTKIVGRVDLTGGHCRVIPIHRRFTTLLSVPAGAYKDDDIVICEIKRIFPERGTGSGRVKKILGNMADKGIENLIVLTKYDLHREFLAAVEKEAAQVAEDMPLPGENLGRFDLRDLYTVTIDGETARDFDDAISVIRTDEGFTLYVHIADVSHYVRPGGPLDDEAYRRGTSVYFPEFAIPMLPEVLSNGACSLRPDEDRFAFTVKIDYDGTANRLRKTLYRSVIRSDRRLTYTYVNSVLGGERDDKALETLTADSLALMELIKTRRQVQGMLDIDLPEVHYALDAEGNITQILPAERGISERIIEHFMIEVNEAASETLEEKSPLGLFRVHAKPDLSKLSDWAAAARDFGFDAGEIPGAVTPTIVQKWLEQIEGKRYSYIIRSLLVRSLQRAEYTPENIGHFGLASESYTHFTSPIRRYPDLITHRLLKRYVFKEDYSFDEDWMKKAAAYTSAMERNADEAEREIDLYKKLAYLRDNPGKPFAAYINKVTPGGIGIFLTELLMFGFIDNETLPIKGYRSGRGVHYAGDALTVIWSHTDWDRLEATFVIDSVEDTNEIHRAAGKKTAAAKKKSSTKPGHYRKFIKKKRRK